MLQIHSLYILHSLQVPKIHACINKVCSVHYCIPLSAAPLYFSIYTTAVMMTTPTTSITTRTLTVATTGTRNGCWGVLTVGGTEVVATIVIVVVTADVDVAGN